ncbi:MAG: hypothetical protein GF383_09675 [Candidatus Lokiarchaeota archaeon]|nr:hypothetical protein [Candidatus Lokiarchaeota archaeon]MBD3340793.1 hypothetical protein [Candidatus Lokiarchaeota archaeon]
MDLHKNYEYFKIHAFWSNDITLMVRELKDQYAKGYATQHDIILRFLNDALFRGEGQFSREFRKRNKKYPDLSIPKEETKGFEVLELRTHTNKLKYLRRELRKRKETFSVSDHLYFSYFLKVGSKQKGKIIKDRACIYYLVVIKISKQTLSETIDELVEAIRMGTKDFTKELAKKSQLDEEKEELLGVENIVKVDVLERELSLKIAELDEKDKQLDEKDKQLDEKDKQLDEKDKQLLKERKMREAKEREIKRLKARLKNDS